jgi:hypothetical protein
MAIIKKQDVNNSWQRCGEIRTLAILLMRTQDSTTTVENCMEGPQKNRKRTTTMQQSHF